MKTKKQKLTQTTGWECDNCGTFSEEYEDAIACCPSVSEVKAWLCPSCNTVYDNTFDARECCRVYEICKKRVRK